jgi:hypothetical protein
VVGAEGLPASIAVKLITTGTKELAADRIGARVRFQRGVPAIFVVLDRNPLNDRVAVGAGGGSELLSHVLNNS